MKAVAKKLLQYKPQNVVIDPVMYAKNGCPLMNPTAVSTLIDTVIPLADVLTPNIPEAEKIADMQISTVSDMEAAARKIYAIPETGFLLNTQSYVRLHCLPVVLRVFGRGSVYSCRIDKPLITAYNRIVILSCYNRKMQKIKIFRPL